MKVLAFGSRSVVAPLLLALLGVMGAEAHDNPALLRPAVSPVDHGAASIVPITDRPCQSAGNIEQRVRSLLVEHLGVAPSQVTARASLTKDLGADELDIVEIDMAIEEEFDIEIPDTDANQLITVAGIVDYLRKRCV